MSLRRECFVVLLSKTIDGLRMDNAIDILPSGVSHGAVLFQLAIARVFVSRDQANFFGDGFANEAVQSFSVGIIDDASHDIALALNGANNSLLAFASGPFCALIPVAVSVFPAD